MLEQGRMVSRFGDNEDWNMDDSPENSRYDEYRGQILQS